MGKDDKACCLGAQAIRLMKEWYGDKNLSTTNAMLIHASALRDPDRLEEAESQGAQVLALAKENLGRNAIGVYENTRKAYDDLVRHGEI